jgi:hypothetical protein
VYVYRKETDETQLILQKEEVECAKWFDLEETYRACLARDQKFCVPIGGLKVLMSYLEQNPEH